MIFKIAWLNIWRSPLRSFVVLGFGDDRSLGINFAFKLSLLGWLKAMSTMQFRIQTSHIQLHNPEFKEDQEVKFFIENPEEQSGTKIRQLLNMFRRLLHERWLMACWLRREGPGEWPFVGSIPEAETTVTKFKEKIKQGSYFESREKEPNFNQRKA